MDLLELIEDKNIEEIEKFEGDINFQDLEGKTALHLSCLSNNIEITKILLSKKAEVNLFDRNQETPLNNALKQPTSFELIELLIENGADVNLKDKFDQTALHNALINSSDTQIIKLLIAKGSDIKAKDSKRCKPLHYACMYIEDLEILDTLFYDQKQIHFKDQYQKTPLHYACLYSNIKCVKYLIGKGADINAIDKDRKNPLHFACESEKPSNEIISLLISSGTKPNLRDKRMQIPLHYLVMNESKVENIALLLKHGANIHAQNTSRQTPILKACEYNPNPEVIEFLLKNGANAQHNSYISTQSPIFLACTKHCNSKIIRLLFQYGAQLEFQSTIKKTTIQLACSKSTDLETIKFLVEKTGNNYFIRTSSHKSPFHFACENPNGKPILQYFVEMGVDPYSRDSQSLTALHFACISDAPMDILEYLVDDLGFDVNEISISNKTPLHYACEKGARKELIEFLLARGADTHLKDSQKYIPVFYEMLNNKRIEIIEMLIDEESMSHLPSILYQNMFLTRIFRYRMKFSNLKMIKYFINNFLDLNKTDTQGRDPLFYAIKTPVNFEVLKMLITDETNFDKHFSVFRAPYTYLSLALRSRNDPDIIKFLIKNTKDFSYTTSQNENYLHLACKNVVDEEILNLLIGKGIQINSRDSKNYTPLHAYLTTTFHQQNINILNILLESGADPNLKTDLNQNVLHLACYGFPNYEILKKLIDVIGKTALNELDSSNNTPLHKLCSNIRLKKNKKEASKMIDLLIENGSRLDSKNSQHSTPLHSLCQNSSSFSLIQSLIKHGADPNTQGQFSRNPLHVLLSKIQFNPKIIRLLVDSGVNINEVDSQKNTPLHYLIKRSFNLEDLELLCNSKIVNIQNNYGKTPLFSACEFYPNFEVIEFLIKKGSTVKLKTNNKKSIFSFVDWKTLDQEIVELLLSKKAKFSEKPARSPSSLSLAIVNSDEKLSHFLIQKYRKSYFSVITSAYLSSAKTSLLLQNHMIDFNTKIDNEPLFISLIKRYYESDFIKKIIEMKPNFQEKSLIGLYPIHYLCDKDPNPDILRLFIENYPDINLYSPRKQTPLHRISSVSNNIECYKILIEKGADVNCLDQRKYTPLMNACLNNASEKVLEFLISKGAELNEQNEMSKTALTYCIEKRNTRNAECLLKNGALVDFPVKKSPLYYACFLKDQKMVKLLLLYNAQVYDSENFVVTEEIQQILDSHFSICTDMNNLFQRQEFTDQNVQCIGGNFSIHSLIVKLRLNNGELNNQQIEQIFNKMLLILSKQEVEDAKIFMQFIYSGIFPKSKPIIESQKIVSEILSEIYEKPEEWIERKKGRNGIIRDLDILFQNQSTKNFTILFSNSNHSIHVDKLILVARSELYRGMFLSVEDDSNQVHDYSGKSFETVQKLVRFLYLDEINISSKNSIDNFDEFVDLIDYYQLNEKSRMRMVLEKTYDDLMKEERKNESNLN
ncbi:ankyrin repeat-containing protein [Anaeramoeba ignava]|uniref:Ankyrin repeat-containing protein n=1 Tax=Anaeramoeba ignava TaxID=1746090 RepID=A0A9Q0RAW7_ANAIG|nr:ankyrin repeat-containing protein [Anaeramoeba ignava]